MISATNFLPLPPLAQPRSLTANAMVTPQSDPKIAKTAREFEATFLGMLLKEMRQTLDEEGGLFPGDAGDVQGGMFDLFLSQHLADAGGIGFAKVIEQQLRPPAQATDARRPAAAVDRPLARPSAP